MHLLCIYKYKYSFIHLCHTNIYSTIDRYTNIYIQVHAFEVARPPKVLSDIRFEALELEPRDDPNPNLREKCLAQVQVSSVDGCSQQFM